MSLRIDLGDPAWLFDLGISISRFDVTSSPTGRIDDLKWTLSDDFQLPPLDSLSQDSTSANLSSDQFRVWAAWHEKGLFFQVDMPSLSAVKKEIRGLPSTPDELILYVDTRGSSGIHRANRYCYLLRFAGMLSNSPGSQEIHCGVSLPIPRASEPSAPVPAEDLRYQVTRLEGDGQRWKLFVRGTGLVGYDPLEFPDIGLFLACSRLGNRRVLARTVSAPFHEDPSAWCRAKLI